MNRQFSLSAIILTPIAAMMLTACGGSAPTQQVPQGTVGRAAATSSRSVSDAQRVTEFLQSQRLLQPMTMNTFRSCGPGHPCGWGGRCVNGKCQWCAMRGQECVSMRCCSGLQCVPFAFGKYCEP